jgi:hypothetical protein
MWLDVIEAGRANLYSLNRDHVAATAVLVVSFGRDPVKPPAV